MDEPINEEVMRKFPVGSTVVVNTLPPNFLRGLAKEDKAAIKAIIGKPITLAGYSFGQAELEFIDSAGDNHSIWVDPSLLQAA